MVKNISVCKAQDYDIKCLCFVNMPKILSYCHSREVDRTV